MTPTPITNAQLNASGYLDAAELVRFITNMMDRGNIAATSKIGVELRSADQTQSFGIVAIEVILRSQGPGALTICIEED